MRPALLLAAAGAAALIGLGGRASADRLQLAPLPLNSGFVDGFAFDPHNPQVVYVLAVGDGGGRVFKTVDGGAHWRATATSGSGRPGANEALAADTLHPGTLYVGTSTGVDKTVDGGRSWHRSNRGLLAPPRDPPDFRAEGKGRVTALAVDPADPSVVYAGSDRVSRSSDGGRTWTAVFPPHAVQYRDSVSALAIAPTTPEAIYAITAHFADGVTSIDESTDAGATWHAATVVRGIQGGGEGFATALAVDPRQPATVYAALGATVLKTTDAGKTWTPIGRGLPVKAGLPRGGCHCQGGVTTLAVDPRRTGTVYAALSQGPLYETTDAGRAWTRVTPTTLALSGSTLGVDPARPATIYAATESVTGAGPRLLRSTDGGRTWVVTP